MDTLLTEFGLHLAQIRQQHNLSQEQLAEKSGLHRTYISSLERGKRNPTIVTLNALSEALNISLSDLVNWKRLN
ncbi:helix-turn-helix domain-containing protein [Neisseria weaveri]|uniref:helix-turn-helix domain-containing protein n=1 Tax=Neisseria weaveri TaxID=28091 RepID=UPI0009EDE002|nr:helix-turn-helix transcriptional regulator [Neisseria weaveri]